MRLSHFRETIFLGLSTVAWLLFFTTCAEAQAGQAPAGCSSPETVLQRYIDAVGGKAAVEKLQTRKAEARESEPSSFNPTATNTYKYEFKWKVPNNVALKIALGVKLMPMTFGSWHFIFDGADWSDSRGKRLPPQRNQQPWRKRLLFDYPHNAMRRVAADPLMVARPRELYSNVDLADENAQPGVCVLRAQGWDNRLDYLYFDAVTGFLTRWELQMVQPKNPYYITFRFDNYRRAGDVKFPFHLYVDFYKATFDFTKVTHNLPLADSDFRLR